MKKWLEQTDDKPADLEDDVIASNAENLENGMHDHDLCSHSLNFVLSLSYIQNGPQLVFVIIFRHGY